MRRGLLSIAVAAVAVLAVGCAQVDYPCITDESQTVNSSGFVSTSGKAHIDEFVQIAVILGDGTVHEIINFLNQKVTGGGTVNSDMTNYDHSAPDLGSFIFHSDQYCNTESVSCSAATNTDNAFCGDGKGGISIASGPCSDGLILLFGDVIRDNECGKAAVTDPVPQLANLSIVDAINLIASNSTLVDIDGVTWHEMSLTPGLTLSFDNGSVANLAMPAVPVRVRFASGFKLRALVDASGPEFANVLYDLQSLADANPGARFSVTADLFGQVLNLSGSFRLVDNELVPGFYAEKAQRIWGS